MRDYMLVAAALLLCASVHAQDVSSSTAVEAAIQTAQATPASTAPKHFGRPTCNRVLPGCRRCTEFFVRRQARTKAAAASATPDNFGSFRKVFVCTECSPGFTLTGSQNPNDPNPASCVPNGGGECGVRLQLESCSPLAHHGKCCHAQY